MDWLSLGDLRSVMDPVELIIQRRVAEWRNKIDDKNWTGGVERGRLIASIRDGLGGV